MIASKRGRNTDLMEAIDKIDVEDWMAYHGVDYRITSGTSGQQINVKECPRCHGSDWKVFINAENGLGNCFHGTCVGEPGFTLFSFSMELLRKSKADIARYITDYAKSQGWRPKVTRKAVVIEHALSVKLPPSEPLTLTNNIQYLEDRGIDGRVAERFGLRICEVGYYDYVDGFGMERKQKYSDRIIIPIRSITGEIVTFQGRDTTGEADPKYLFPPMLPGTGRYLYNGHRAKGKKNLVMGEGAFDVFSIDIAFEDHDSVGAIGSFGKSFSGGDKDANDQLRQLSMLKESGAETLTFMWDSEPKTIADACDAVERVKRVIPDVRIAILPPGCDPNEVSDLQIRVAYAKAVKATKANIFKLRLNAGK